MRTLILALLACLPLQAATVTLSWTDPQTSVTWNVYRADEACDPGATFGKINTSAVTVRNYTDANMGPGRYCYYVTAEANGLESDGSNTAQANVQPGRPTDLSITVEVAVTIRTDCGQLSRRTWKSSGLPPEPLGVPAEDTQRGDGCAPFATAKLIRVDSQ